MDAATFALYVGIVGGLSGLGSFVVILVEAFGRRRRAGAVERASVQPPLWELIPREENPADGRLHQIFRDFAFDVAKGLMPELISTSYFFAGFGVLTTVAVLGAVWWLYPAAFLPVLLGRGIGGVLDVAFWPRIISRWGWFKRRLDLRFDKLVAEETEGRVRRKV